MSMGLEISKLLVLCPIYTIIDFKDLSIVPTCVSANTASTALVIGEKAAMIIAKELGITLS